MKLIYVVIDGMGDLPVRELKNETPLGAADTPNLDDLARGGRTGLMYTVRKGIAPESDVAVISILGYDPFKYAPGRGVLEAVGAGLHVKNGDLALRCNFATSGEGRQIIDRRAGRDLTTKESLQLSQTVSEKVALKAYPVDFEFKSTIGHRAVLVIRSRAGPLSSMITNTDPGYTRIKELGVAEKEVEMVIKTCEPMDESSEARVSAALVNEFIQTSHKVLSDHEVNKNRIAGKVSGKCHIDKRCRRQVAHILYHWRGVSI